MQEKSKFRNSEAPLKKAEVLDRIWQGLDDNYYVVAAQPLQPQAVAPQPEDDKPAGWIRNKPIPGL